MESPSKLNTAARPRALFEVTERAALKARALLTERGTADGVLHVKVTAGGCSGFSYSLEPWTGPIPVGDHVVKAHDVTVFIDKKSLLFLAGATLDYQDDVFSRKFVFKNPNAAGTCSCGESFGV